MRVRVGTAADIPPGERKFVRVDGIEVAVLNVAGEFYSVRNRCPHMEGPVGRGPTSRDANGAPRIECPFHAWTFDLASGEATFDPRRSVRTFEVTVRDGEVYVEV